MISTKYELIPEMSIEMDMCDDIWWNSQRTTIRLKAPAQPFQVDWQEKEIIEFTVVWNRELSELISWLQQCQKSCYKQHKLQINCAYLDDCKND